MKATVGIYLDNAAATKLDERVFEAMKPALQETFGNPLSPHRFGQSARALMDGSRAAVARILSAKPSEIVFTSGGTESNNLALRMTAATYTRPHFIVSAVEHHSILDTATSLESQDRISLSLAPVDHAGRVETAKLLEQVTAHTRLISVQYVNNEIGTLQPVVELAQKIAELNTGRSQPILFHIDAVQAVPYFDLDVSKLNCDLLSISGHKLHGPKGAGALYIKSGTKLTAVMTGGEQESGRRAGTPNVAGAVGLAKALELLQQDKSLIEDHVGKLRQKLLEGAEVLSGQLELLGSREFCSPAIVCFRLKQKNAEPLLAYLDQKGIAVGSGSACVGGAITASHVLTAMGYADTDRRSLRVSLSHTNTVLEIETLLDEMSNFFQ